MVKDSSVVAVQIFDQRKFKRRDQGFLGVVNVQVSNALDLELGGHGTYRPIAVLCLVLPLTRSYYHNRDVAIRPEAIQR